jgi:molybdopterin-containing oxidoreductase family membrane subunit
MAYPGAGESVALAEMATGRTAPFFWFEVLGGLLLPFLLLVFSKNREKTGVVVFASVMVVLGVCCKRLWLLFTSFVYPNVDGANGITLGSQTAQADPFAMWSIVGTYAPTGVELMIALGTISLGVLAFVVLSRRFLSAHADR